MDRTKVYDDKVDVRVNTRYRYSHKNRYTELHPSRQRISKLRNFHHPIQKDCTIQPHLQKLGAHKTDSDVIHELRELRLQLSQLFNPSQNNLRNTRFRDAKNRCDCFAALRRAPIEPKPHDKHFRIPFR